MIVALILMGSFVGCIGASIAFILEESALIALLAYSFTGSLGTLIASIFLRHAKFLRHHIARYAD